MANTSVALTGASAGLNILSGLMGMDAADSRAGALRSRAQLLEREAEADAQRYAAEAAAFKASQKMAFIKSGVQISGSPLDVLDETARVTSENLSAIRARGAAQASSLRSEAAATKAESRLNFLRAGLGATETVAKVGVRLGWWAPEAGGEDS
jgi:hypothetical protein